MDKKLRAESLIQAISVCTFVDTCPKHCNPSDQEACYGIVVDRILTIPQIAKALEYYRLMHSHGHDVEQYYRE